MSTYRRVIFRLSPYNRLSFPVLLNAWEQCQLDREFEIIIREPPLEPEDICEGDVIVFSVMTVFLPDIHHEIVNIRKSRKRNILIVGGGPHITGEQELSGRIGFDVLFIGPGERNFLQFGKDLLENRAIPERYIQNENSISAEDFNRHLPISKYIKTIPPLEIMRGCFWNCAYCCTHLYDVQFRDSGSIDMYLREMKRRKLNRVNFVSPSSMEYGASKGRQLNLEKIEELLKLTHSYGFRFVEYGIFPSEIRPDTVTDEGMALLKKYVSNKYITIGAQSGLDTRLKEIKRGHTIEDIERAIITARNHGFSAQLDFIVGYPEETPEERRVTVEFIKKVNKKYRVRSHLHHFIPLSGSPYENRLPSFLSEEEKERLHRLRKGGVVIDGWVENEKQVKHYLDFAINIV